jgi:hypothetical protein
MQLWSLLVSLGFADRLPLGDIPIVGADDPEILSLVREKLADFERDVGEGRVALVEVRFAPRRTLGAFSPRTGRIVLASDLSPDELPDVLGHELCHALDFAEDLVAQPVAEFDALGFEVVDPARGGRPVQGSPRFRRREAFAAWCALGADTAQHLTTSDEPERVTEAAHWLVERVWLGAVPALADGQ